METCGIWFFICQVMGLARKCKQRLGLKLAFEQLPQACRKQAMVVVGIGGRLTDRFLFLSILLISFVITRNLYCLYKRKQSLGDKSKGNKVLSDLVSAFCLDVEWTEWFDHDKVPQSKGGEKISDLRAAYPGKICNRPIDIQVLTTQQSGSLQGLPLKKALCIRTFLFSFLSFFSSCFPLIN